MNQIRWNEQKSQHLKQTRGVSFNEIITQRLADIIQHPTREDQRLYIFIYEDYCWAVPCVINGEGVFLKTLYRSIKFTRKYLNKEL